MRAILIYLATGVAVGLLAGLFGVGGGLIAVPVLMYVLGFDHRQAAGTSLLAIILPVFTAAISYLSAGNYSLALAGLLAAGSMVGVQLGTRALRSVNVQVVRLIFAATMSLLAASLLLVLPQRELSFTVSVTAALIVVAIGLLAGFVAGILGIGGGGIVIPLLILCFGMSDLVAKGSSLLMMVATTTTGTIANMRYGHINYRAALSIGVCALASAPVGAWIAAQLSPRVANTLFAGFLAAVIVKTLLEFRRGLRVS